MGSGCSCPQSSGKDKDNMAPENCSDISCADTKDEASKPLCSDSVKPLSVYASDLSVFDDGVVRTSEGTAGGLLNTNGDPHKISAISWNIAAINNNPFEYWMDSTGKGSAEVSAAEAAYTKLMHEAEAFIIQQKESIGEDAVKVKDVMTPQMFSELCQLLESKEWVGLEETRRRYKEDLSERAIINEVLFDPALGKKRLCSWPDRFCNTIRCVDAAGLPLTLYRPSVINFSNSNDLSAPKTRWKSWKHFVFELQVRKSPGKAPMFVSDMLAPLKKSKYPELTAEEERISMPLQVLCLAIFDMIMFRIVDTAAPDKWLSLKRRVVHASGNKNTRTLEILRQNYSDIDVICISEASAGFLNDARAILGTDYLIPTPLEMDSKKDQNSFLLLHKRTFGGTKPQDITAKALACFPDDKPLPLTTGDLFVLYIATPTAGFVLASFHGDTQGLSTLPMLTAMAKLVEKNFADCQLIIGLDANAYVDGQHGKRLDLDEMGDWLREHGWRSCFGVPPDKKMITTCAARTFLQPQMNKAHTAATRSVSGDTNPKDHILFLDGDVQQKGCAGCRQIGRAHRDNTGSGCFVSGVTFPSLSFPSDHALIGTLLELKH